MIHNQRVTWSAYAILAMFFFSENHIPKTERQKDRKTGRRNDKKTEREKEGMIERQKDKKTILRQKKAGSKKTKK